MKTNEAIIKREILNIEKPFKISDLLDKLAKLGINDRNLIFEVLDRLINSGLVTCNDIEGIDISYCSILAKSA